MSKRSGAGLTRTRHATLLLTLLAGGCAARPTVSSTGQGVSVTVSPASATVTAHGQQVFTATVTGTADTSVSWRVPEPACGSITPDGIYRAPDTAASCRVIATSNVDPNKSASSHITVEAAAPANPETIWEPLKIGGGGWVTGFDTCATGQAVYLLGRTDTYGAYLKLAGSGTWQQLVRSDTMPAAFLVNYGEDDAVAHNQGVWEVRFAPSDCSTLYMAFRQKVYKSTNRGATWTETAFSFAGTFDPNGAQRMWGEKMAVDPADANVVYLGTSNGLYVTFDGGASWALVSTSAIPVPSGSFAAAGVSGILFDPLSGTTGGRTNTIYAASNGNGVYHSTDAGATWTRLGSAGQPSAALCVSHADVSGGAYFAVCKSDGTGALHKFASGAWSDLAVGNILHAVVVDPFDPTHIVVGEDGGALNVSTNGGSSWTREASGTRAATDVPWLAWTRENYMSSGAIRFDPVTPDRLWFSEGIGVWRTDDPYTPANGTLWSSESAGIEQLCAKDIALHPSSPNVALTALDRNVFVVPRSNTSYPQKHGGTMPNAPTTAIVHGYSIRYAEDNALDLVTLTSPSAAKSGYSRDGGTSWTPFPSQALQTGSGGGGQIIATTLGSCPSPTTASNIIAVVGTAWQSYAGGAWRSTDCGASWTLLQLPDHLGTGAPYLSVQTSWTDLENLHHGSNSAKQPLTIDGVDPNTIYLYFFGRGLYRSRDGGATWELRNTTAAIMTSSGESGFWQARLRSVHGNAGHLFIASGHSGSGNAGNPAGNHLWRSSDGGATWTTVPGILEPYDVSLGKEAPRATYPTIYVAGWYNNAYGIWRSTDNATTWANVGPFPNGSVDKVSVIAASTDTYGEIYVGFTGSGWAKLSVVHRAPLLSR